ncbi:MAG: metallophosphoesterase family protein [Pseudomonadota bacterium]
MTTEDWGEFDGPALLFGGPVSNLQALEAVLAAGAARGVPAARTVCTGDLAAYCGRPAQTAARARDAGVRIVAGNMEQSLAAGRDDCACGFEDGAACDLLAKGWFAHCDREVGAELRAWMGGLPERAVVRQAGRRFAVIHGGAREINRFLWPSDPDAVLAEEIAALERELGALDGVICGHSGLAFAREIAGRLWINAGTVGLPPHDGDPRTEFALLEEGHPRLMRLAYDHDAAAADMRAAGLTQGYERTLETGWWPSEDVLPAALRRASAA